MNTNRTNGSGITKPDYPEISSETETFTGQSHILGGSSFPKLDFNVISGDLSYFGKLQELF